LKIKCLVIYVLFTISRKKVKPSSYAQIWRLLDENGQPHNHKQDQSVYFLIDISDR
jgi:hypothetical protein